MRMNSFQLPANSCPVLGIPRKRIMNPSQEFWNLNYRRCTTLVHNTIRNFGEKPCDNVEAEFGMIKLLLGCQGKKDLTWFKKINERHYSYPTKKRDTNDITGQDKLIIIARTNQGRDHHQCQNGFQKLPVLNVKRKDIYHSTVLQNMEINLSNQNMLSRKDKPIFLKRLLIWMNLQEDQVILIMEFQKNRAFHIYCLMIKRIDW